MSSTWYDEYFEGECEDEKTNLVMDFTGKCESCNESSDEDISDEELAETYKLLYIKWEEVCMFRDKQKKSISGFLFEKEKLVATITSLQEEVALGNSKIENMIKSL